MLQGIESRLYNLIASSYDPHVALYSCDTNNELMKLCMQSFPKVPDHIRELLNPFIIGFLLASIYHSLIPEHIIELMRSF
jgi:hypothetical protein